jgi:alcohol dehydrogenase
MRALVLSRYGGPEHTALTEVPRPSPRDGEVLVRVHAAGLNPVDLKIRAGELKVIQRYPLPIVMGNELSGVVEAVGRDVRKWRRGDRVTVPFVCGCGECPQCQGGHQQVCDHQFQPGFTHWGSFAEFVALAHADLNLVALPDGMAFDTAASLLRMNA